MVDLLAMTETSTDKVQKLKAAREAGQTVTEPMEYSASTNASIRESLSALVDGEASEMEIHRLLKLAESDPAVEAQWRRYHLVRSALKGERDFDPSVDISSRISAAIAEEASLKVGERTPHWGHNVGKVAIAASVTFAFILGVQQFGSQEQDMSPQTAELPAPAATSSSNEVVGSVPSGFELPSFSARTVSTGSAPSEAASAQLVNRYSSDTSDAQLQNKALQNHFNHLLNKHAESSSSNGSMGLIPYARNSGAELQE